MKQDAGRAAHIIESAIPVRHFLSNADGMKIALIAESWIDYFYFLLKMDHLLCVPALIFLYIGLKRIDSSSNLNTRKKGRF